MELYWLLLICGCTIALTGGVVIGYLIGRRRGAVYYWWRRRTGP